jgi:hypothetical protein
MLAATRLNLKEIGTNLNGIHRPSNEVDSCYRIRAQSHSAGNRWLWSLKEVLQPEIPSHFQSQIVHSPEVSETVVPGVDLPLPSTKVLGNERLVFENVPAATRLFIKIMEAPVRCGLEVRLNYLDHFGAVAGGRNCFHFSGEPGGGKVKGNADQTNRDRYIRNDQGDERFCPAPTPDPRDIRN